MTGLDIRPHHNQTTPTERTPLLGDSARLSQNIYASPDTTANGLPHVGTFVAQMIPEHVHKYTIDSLYPPMLESHSERTAFSLCALLYFRKYLRQAAGTPRGRDVWAQWQQEQCNTTATYDVDTLVEQVWAHFLTEGSSEDLLVVFSSAFPLYPDSCRSIRVVDFLASGDVPSKLTSHSLVNSCLLDVWRHGFESRDGSESTLSQILHFIDSTGTPRVLHILDLSVYVIYLGLLFSYLVNPPIRAEDTALGTRAALILVYSLARLCRPLSPSTWPFGLVLLAFIGSLPSTPSPDSFGYSALLVAFCCQVILLHLPVHPCTIFLLSPSQILPLAVLLWRGLFQTFVPVIVFFIPGLLISLLFLSISLSDKFLWLSMTPLVAVSPLGARLTFLALFATIFVLLCCSLGYSVLVHPFVAPLADPALSPWDRYSNSVGLEARKAFARVVVAYSKPYYFPAPLNILQLLLIRAPTAVLALAGRKLPPKSLELVEKALWRVTVAPFAFAVSALWLWNLRTG